MKYATLFLVLLALPLVLASTAGNTTVSFTVVVDVDGDGVFDHVDTLIGDETFINTVGIANPNVTVDGNDSSGTFTGMGTVEILDGTEVLVSFVHNFSNSTIFLEDVEVNVTSDGIFVDVDGQLLPGETKTIYLEDNIWIGLCAHDAAGVTNISDDCNVGAEVDFGACISGDITIGHIVCNFTGTHYAFSNLTFSAARGYMAPDRGGLGFTGSGSNPLSVTCFDEYYCTTWSPCNGGEQSRTCRSVERCVTNLVFTPTETPPAVTSACSVFPSCLNNIKDGLETDIDCGGLECDGCQLKGICENDRDCISETCILGLCEERGVCVIDSDCVGSEICLQGSCYVIEKVEQFFAFPQLTFSLLALLIFLIVFIGTIYYIFTEDEYGNI